MSHRLSTAAPTRPTAARVRAIMASLAAVALAIVALLAPGTARAGPSLVFEADTNRVLFADEPDRPWYPASLTKLMTAYVVFEALRRDGVDPKWEIEISPRANAQPPSRVGLGAGRLVSVEEALAGLIIQSGNDVAVALAEAVSGSEAEFVEEMNATAFRLGMLKTRFVNPHGLPGDGQATTARDMGLLARALLRDFPEWSYLYALKTAPVGPRTVGSHNDVLTTFEGGDGMKTGFTCGAGYNVVASATRGGRKIIAVVLGERNNKARTLRAERLLEFGFATSPVAQAEDPALDPEPVAAEALVDVPHFGAARHASEAMQIRNCWPPGKAPPAPVLIATAPDQPAAAEAAAPDASATAAETDNGGNTTATIAPAAPSATAAAAVTTAATARPPIAGPAGTSSVAAVSVKPVVGRPAVGARPGAVKPVATTARPAAPEARRTAAGIKRRRPPAKAAATETDDGDETGPTVSTVIDAIGIASAGPSGAGSSAQGASAETSDDSTAAAQTAPKTKRPSRRARPARPASDATE